MSASNFGGASPLKFWAENLVFSYAILWLYCKSDWNKISSIGKWHSKQIISYRYQVWWTLVQQRRKLVGLFQTRTEDAPISM